MSNQKNDQDTKSSKKPENDGEYVGEYKDEKPRNGIYYDKNENIIGKFVNGERIKQ